jgi:hypothetical protein
MVFAAGQASQSPPSALAVISTLVVLLLSFSAIIALARPRQRREAPLRAEIRRRPVIDFHANVAVRQYVLGVPLSVSGPLELIVRGDAFEVRHVFPPARFMFGQCWCFRAPETTIELDSSAFREWIPIRGLQETRIAISGRKKNRMVWDMLLWSGAQPAGSLPQP